MGNPKAISLHLGVYAKGTLCPLIYFLFLQKVYRLCLSNKWIKWNCSLPRHTEDITLIFCRWQPYLLQSHKGGLCHFRKSIKEIWACIWPTTEPRKSSLFFSWNTPQDIQDDIKNMFGAEVIQQHEKYLGLPSLVGKNKCNTFQQLMEGLNNKLSNWKKKLLSHVRKEILIKTVAQAVPTYTMNVFKLPNNLCDEMTSMVLRFWKGQANEKKNGLVKLG